jgi:TRAP-type C4-dicarboxylate transport system permease small subunit
MEKIWAGIDKIIYAAGYLGGWVLLGIIGLTMLEVVTRYVINQPLILCDEFGGYSLFAITFLGLAYCAREKGHIRITFLVERISPKAASQLRILTLFLALLFIGAATKVSWDFIISSFVRNMRSNSWLMTPLKWPHMVMPVGFTLFTIVLILQFAKAIKALKTGSKAEEGGAKEEY